MRVERVSDNARKQKFKVKDERQQSLQVDQARKQEIERIKVEAKNGDKKAQQQVRQLDEQEKKETRAQDSNQKNDQRKAKERAQGERVGNSPKSQSKGAATQERNPQTGGQLPKAPAKAKAKGNSQKKP